ncbi:hypothetical protein KTE69_30110 [Burkholderia multivorans]|uniref:hypothetical protein n=1 Tax=Burkholderia multivorans TaxID=87883 RepID=UPI0015E45B61|nr:hypothetical protein [Burkholderia multivorans]MBU9372614.1 hypothetical protein [Burkholderia multivorans]MBU9412839.1 hypothetical protein [Burkholderia multivorans]UXZ82824.1 hypothetical protein NUJ31_01995 [Burkholderia multivorans]
MPDHNGSAIAEWKIVEILKTNARSRNDFIATIIQLRQPNTHSSDELSAPLRESVGFVKNFWSLLTRALPFSRIPARKVFGFVAAIPSYSGAIQRKPDAYHRPQSD